jgi:hypothetical protein
MLRIRGEAVVPTGECLLNPLKFRKWDFDHQFVVRVSAPVDEPPDWSRRIAVQSCGRVRIPSIHGSNSRLPEEEW